MSPSASTESPHLQEDNYEFRVPIASSIYLRPSPEETFLALADMNKSLPPTQRLPAEILSLINDELHTVDSAYAELRSKWTPLLEPVDLFGEICPSKLSIIFDRKKKAFLISRPIAWAGVWMDYGEGEGKDPIEDTLQLLNMLFDTVDGKRFTYYHPAAFADLPTPEQRFLAVPYPDDDFSVENSFHLYFPWFVPYCIPRGGLASSTFKSFLSRLKYNPQSRKVNLENGTENLTTIMSSSLLYYRLSCRWNIESANIYDKHPITSVWQFILQHRTHYAWILFIDDCGLFDIRVNGDESKIMDDIVALGDALFSGGWSHPNGHVAGSV
ncbi:hypothetical protein Clacol_002265 [Clathrus columnatus]|uniref:Uncharacterized protein n=1 Tax=Clathrus columnatus TaxID=1419009 RepID=A0AAV5A3K8_9AGAM|nr:hypothetical protein Clacol_002265 [Clathrus columnatus]